MTFYGVIYPRKNGRYAVHFPDFSGAFTSGKDYEDARIMGIDALLETIRAYKKEGRQMPKPMNKTEITEIASQHDFNDGCGYYLFTHCIKDKTRHKCPGLKQQAV